MGVIWIIIKGFRFGMLLQIAVGPICVFIFNEAVEKGMRNALVGVLAVVIIDALYIMLSIWGISALVEKNKKLLKYFGAVILIFFGCKTIIDSFDTGVIPIVNSDDISYLKIFITATTLTASNPLTIIFWSGVFSSKVIEEGFSRKDELKFGCGAILATLVFLTFITIFGQFTQSFLAVQYIAILNRIVGILLIYFGVRLFKTKVDKKQSSE